MIFILIHISFIFLRLIRNNPQFKHTELDGIALEGELTRRVVKVFDFRDLHAVGVTALVPGVIFEFFPEFIENARDQDRFLLRQKTARLVRAASGDVYNIINIILRANAEF